MIFDLDLRGVPDYEATRIRSRIFYAAGTSLDLLDARVTDTSAIAIANALPSSTLTRLDLRYNAIGDIGGRALLWAAHRSKVKKIELFRTGVSDTIIRAINRAIRRRPHRDKLFLLLRLMVFWRFDGDNAMVYRVAEFLLG